MAASQTLVFIPEASGNPYFDSVAAGLKAGCNAADCSFSMVGPATFEAASQIPFIAEQIARRVDVLAIAPNSATALNDILDRARAAGILVVAVNSDLSGNPGRRDAA